MAVRFDSTTDYLTTSSSLLNKTTFTVCVWAKLMVAGADNVWQALWSHKHAEGSDGYELAFGEHNITPWLKTWEVGNPQTYIDPTAYTGTVGQDAIGVWAFFAFSRASMSSRSSYLWTPGDGWRSHTGVTGTSTFGTSQTEQWASWMSGGDPFNGSLAFFRSWNAALSEAELQAERTKPTPQRLTDLHRVLRLRDASSALTDTSGNGYDVSKGAGTLTDDTDPSYVESEGIGVFGGTVLLTTNF